MTSHSNGVKGCARYNEKVRRGTNGSDFGKKQQGVLVRESEDAPATTKKCAVGKKWIGNDKQHHGVVVLLN
ncbi:MAG: hypothetical protein GY820_30160 [Gammaproteobacteria bacterium]|nr:hypothetical protein [Gammaproteobacteria bacterium]